MARVVEVTHETKPSGKPDADVVLYWQTVSRDDGKKILLSSYAQDRTEDGRKQLLELDRAMAERLREAIDLAFPPEES